MNGELYAVSYQSRILAFYTNGTPEASAATLNQYKMNGTTKIVTGEWTNQSTVVFKMNATDPDYNDIFRLQVELKPTSEAFNGTGLSTGEGVVWTRGGGSITVVCTVEGVADSSAGYHWRARIIDQYGFPTDWCSFGGNLETEIDFKVDSDAPEPPSALNAIAMPQSSPTYVALSWTAGTDETPRSELEGYYYYRSPTSMEGYVMKNAYPISGTSTTDSAVTNGSTYYYKVTLKDQAGNESPYSNLSSPPNLILNRIMTIESPKTGGYSGGAGDAVPGSTITYTISYTNNGFGIASGIVFIDKVPVYTEYKIGSATGEMISSVAFSNNGGSLYSYSPTGEAVDPNVTNIKWTCMDLPVNQSKTVRFKVVIK